MSDTEKRHKNVTLRLEKDLLRKARRLAVEQDKSLSQWLTNLIQQTTAQEVMYQVARKRALKRLKKGFDLGGSRLSRDELHER